MHKPIMSVSAVIASEYSTLTVRQKKIIVLVFLGFCALCFTNIFQSTNQNLFLITFCLFIFSFFTGFVFVSGDTVMAAKYFFFFSKKIRKLQNNINQLQLICGHFPGTKNLNHSGSPFLSFLWFYAGTPSTGLPAFYLAAANERSCYGI